MIRQERVEDYDVVYEVVKQAFQTSEHSDGNEQDLVQRLRQGESFVPELSLVIEKNGGVAGHILFTRASIGNEPVVALAPLSILPEFQGQGMGSSLIEVGHEIAKNLGYKYSIVLGDPTFYTRFGYQSGREFAIQLPEGLPLEFFMVAPLQEARFDISGQVKYADEFGLSEIQT